MDEQKANKKMADLNPALLVIKLWIKLSNQKSKKDWQTRI